MKSKIFPSSVLATVEKALADEIKTYPHPIAAFDADGTLWNADLGESFFQYQIRHKLLPNLPADPWRYYRDWKASGDPRPAYLWLAQINQGLPLSQVQKWAADHLQEISPLPVFEEQYSLIQSLQKQGVTVLIVTASVKWSVEPGAGLYGIPPEHVLGVSTKIENGLVSSNPSGQITYREGKAQAILDFTGGRKPFLCSGNTTGDLNMLELATQVRLAVGASNPGDELYNTETELAKIAQDKSWLYYHLAQRP